MNHRHLLPDEIDLLLDNEVGFGVAPLKAHVRDCPECRSRVEEARFVVDSLESLPRFAPSHALAANIMAQVPVFVPWHAAARSAVARFAPVSRPARITAVAMGTSVATVLTLGIVWLLSQTDLLVFATGVAASRLRLMWGSAIHEAATALFGDQVFAALQQSGPLAMALAVGGLVLAALLATLGLRAAALASARRRA